MAPLEKRSAKILRAIVSEYIASGEPVGSRTVAKKTDIGLSAASIRNVMSDLTESGFIVQPHTSAGRIPTDLGYRHYVDTSVDLGPAGRDEQAGIEALIKDPSADVRDMLRGSCSVLAFLSKQAGVVASAATAEQTFKAIEIIKVSEEQILVVLLSASGLAVSKLIYDDDGIKQDTLERYSRMLNDLLKDLDLRQARQRIEQELMSEKAKVDAMLAQMLRFGHIILSHGDTREIFIEGQANILEQPEFAQIERLKAILAAFEEKNNLLKILDKTICADGVQIFIGAEHGVHDMDTCSIVARPVRAVETALGTIAVVGPKRMDYQKMVGLVDSTARALIRLLRGAAERPE